MELDWKTPAVKTAFAVYNMLLDGIEVIAKISVELGVLGFLTRGLSKLEAFIEAGENGTHHHQIWGTEVTFSSIVFYGDVLLVCAFVASGGWQLLRRKKT